MKKIVARMLQMCPQAWYIFMRSIQLSCFMLLLAAVLINSSEGSHKLYMSGISLYECTQAVLMAAVIFSVIVEDIQS